MKKNKTITLSHLISTRLAVYLGIGLLVTVLFNLCFGHFWGRLYTSQHWEQMPNPTLVRLNLADYQSVDAEMLAASHATIEVVDDQLRVIDVRGDDTRLGHTYTLSEFLNLFIEADPNLLVRSQRLAATDGGDVTIILRQQLSMPPFAAFEQLAEVYAVVLVVSSLVIMASFFLLAARSVYKPLQRELDVVNSSLAKVPYDPAPVDVERFSLAEMRSTIATYNTMISEMETMRQEKEALIEQNHRLISNLSHDLKSPMTTLKGYAELLQQDDLPPEEQKRALGYIQSNVTALNTMVELLFEHVRYQHNDYALQLERRDMNNFLRDICANYYMVLDQLGFEITIDIMEEPCYVTFDAINMRRVYANLLENAMSHNPEPTRLQVATRLEDGCFLAAIKDDGSGISPEDRALVFEPYYQGDISRTKAHSGLGLYVAKQIIEKHGGAITLTSEPDYKTVFTIRLPLTV